MKKKICWTVIVLSVLGVIISINQFCDNHVRSHYKNYADYQHDFTLRIIWAIVGVIFLIAFIISLVMLKYKPKNESNNNSTYNNSTSNEEKLSELKKLYDSNLITKDEYEEKRKEIINKI